MPLYVNPIMEMDRGCSGTETGIKNNRLIALRCATLTHQICRGVSSMTNATFTSQQMLAQLVGFDTISTKSNLELIHWVQNYQAGFGVTSTLIHDDTKNKANLHAVIGPEDRAGVVLSGHTDVVPVEGQAWDSDPFALREHDGLLYARGTCDMKGFIAVALAKVPDIVARQQAGKLDA